MIEWLQQWYLNNRNGDWEHEYGIIIQTIDNPGWSLHVDLIETHLQTIEIPYTLWEKDDSNWLGYSIKDKCFNGACDPTRLAKLIGVFRKIFESQDLNVINDQITEYLNQ